MPIERPELKDVDFNEILEIFKLKNRRLLLYSLYDLRRAIFVIVCETYFWGKIPGSPPPSYESLVYHVVWKRRLSSILKCSSVFVETSAPHNYVLPPEKKLL